MNRHLNDEEIAAWTIGEAAAETREHAAGCARCREEVEGLERAFRQFRDSGERWSEHWRTATPLRRPAPLWSWRSLAAAGGLVSAAFVLMLLAHHPAAPKADDEPFVAIPYVAPLAPYERATVVRMEVATTALKAAGFDVHGPELGGSITADVLMGQDGRVHAIRPVSKGERQ
jgi:hypothetical protein